MTKIVGSDALTDFTNEVLAQVGADNVQSRTFTDALVWSDLIGRPTHGVWRLAAYVKRIDLGLIKCPCEPYYLNPDPDLEQAVNVLDGDMGIGHFIGHQAMQRSVILARKFGIGAIGVKNSNHFGTGAYFVDLAARQGMLGIAMSNSFSKVAPHGGVKAVFGTNPFAFGAPKRDGKSIMLDMATTAMAGSEIMKYAEQDLKLPPGIAIDSEGEPILDPSQVGDGTLLHFGGAKGYGLSLMIEILSGALTGGLLSQEVNSMFNNFESSGGNGNFFLAIDIDRFIGRELFYDRIDELVSQLKMAAGEGKTVLFPGESRWENYHRHLKDGIPLDDATIEMFTSLSEKYKITGSPAFKKLKI